MTSKPLNTNTIHFTRMSSYITLMYVLVNLSRSSNTACIAFLPIAQQTTLKSKLQQQLSIQQKTIRGVFSRLSKSTPREFPRRNYFKLLNSMKGFGNDVIYLATDLDPASSTSGKMGRFGTNKATSMKGFGNDIIYLEPNVNPASSNKSFDGGKMDRFGTKATKQRGAIPLGIPQQKTDDLDFTKGGDIPQNIPQKKKIDSSRRGCKGDIINFPEDFYFKTTATSSSSSSSGIISISDDFDGGNIDHVGTKVSDNGDITVELKIKPDPFTELEQAYHFQYFSFRATISSNPYFTSSPRKRKVTYVIVNAGDASYSSAWVDTTTFSYKQDVGSWRRVLNTQYDSTRGELFWTDDDHPIGETVHYAYFPPYSHERHLNLISQCSSSPRCTVTVLGKTIDGRDLECIVAGTGERKAWIIHRQHPGETMAEFYAEGLLSRLLGLNTDGAIDGTAQTALSKYTFYIVPNMCPDGGVRGHLRTNAVGSNLNREWAPSSPNYDAPTLERSPEVYHVLRAMDETGVDMFLDVHGDEELPYNFVAGAEGCPNWGKRLEALQGAFLAAYGRANSDMQSTYGYEPEPPQGGRLNICSNQIATRFDCLSLTLEMPFKDCWSHKDPIRGWCPERAAMLGMSCLDALIYVHPYLRDGSNFWEGLRKEDDYIRPTSKYKN